MNIIANQERINFLPTQFKSHFLNIESLIYNFADNLIVDYDGGYWQFATQETDEFGTAAFLFIKAPPGDEKMSVRNIFTKEPFEVDVVLAGMVITSYAIEFLFNKTQDEFLIDKLDALKTVAMDYAREHGFSKQYFDLTD